MGWGGVAETELMPRLLVGYTEIRGSKLKKRNGVLKPNFGVGPNESRLCSKPRPRDSAVELLIRHPQVVDVFLQAKRDGAGSGPDLGRHLVRAQHNRDLRIGAFNEWSRVVA